MNAIFVWLLGLSDVVLGLGLFALLALACEGGFRFGRAHGRTRTGDLSQATVTATLTSGMIALLAFILGLTVNFAQSRFEARRELVATEAQAIGTAWLRARALGGQSGDALATEIRQYAQTRLDFTRARPGAPADVLIARTGEEQGRIWRLVTDLARAAPSPITATLINAVNEMFDSAQAQRFAFLGEPPGIMLDLMMLGGIIAIGALGFEMGLRGPRQPILTALLLIMWTGAMVVSVDLGRPRLGLVLVDPRPLEWTVHDIGDSPPTAAPVASPK